MGGHQAPPTESYQKSSKNNLNTTLKTIISMKKVLKRGYLEYEQPQLESILLVTERGFANSTMLDDMQEEAGEWVNY